MALTKSDKNWIIATLGNSLDGALAKQESKFENKIIELEEKFEAKLVMFRDDFYTKIDPILKEVLASRDERTILAHQLKGHEDRIEKIETKLKLQPIT